MAVAFGLTSQTIQVLLPLHIVDKDASTFEMELIISVMSCTALVDKIPISIFADRVGKWSIVLIALFANLSLMLYSMAQSYGGSIPSVFFMR